MSAKFGLPSELEKLETELRQQSPQGCEINRDELMYQAGWAAAEVARKLRLGWPTTSGVLAASVVVLAFFLVKSDQQTPVAEAEIEQTTPVVEDSLPNLVEMQLQSVPVVPARYWQNDFSFLVKRHQLKPLDAPEEVPVLASTEVKSVRSLMREFLTGDDWGQQTSVEKTSNQGQLF